MVLHIFFQELVASNPSVYNWKGIIIALVVISQVIGLVIIAVYLMTPPASLLELDGERMHREDVEKGVGLDRYGFSRYRYRYRYIPQADIFDITNMLASTYGHPIHILKLLL